jgi:hypothetical protein
MEKVCRHCIKGIESFGRTKSYAKRSCRKAAGVSAADLQNCKGHENLTLETIANLEIALGIKIIDGDFNKSVA